MARLERITYGSYAVGLNPTSSAVTLEDRYSWDSDENTVTVAFQVLIAASTPEAFGDARQAFVDAMVLPDQALTVVIDSQTEHTYSPSANTGLNTRGSVRKIPGKHNTAISGRFEARITCDLPMTASGRAGRRNGRVQVFTTTSGRRRCVIDATYTAATSGMGGVQSASAQIASAFGTWADSQITALGGTWELLNQSPLTYGQNNKIASASRTYQEIKYAQGLSGLDVAAIRDQRLSINRTDPSINDTTQAIGGGAWSVQKLQLLSVRYACAVDFAVTTDLSSLWESTILPRLDSAIEALASSTAIRSTPEVTFDPVENTIAASVSYFADVGGQFQSMRESLAEQHDSGVILEPVWNGDPFARVKYQGIANSTRTLTRQYVVRSTGTPGAQVGANGSGGNPALGIFGIGQSLNLSGANFGIFGIGQNIGFSFGGPPVIGRGGKRAASGGGSSDASTPPDQGEEWHLVRTRTRESPFTIGPFANGLALVGWQRSWVWIRGVDVSGRIATGSPDKNREGTRTR